jgi:serine-type D-Ala-D-Ala carboxypeptidase
MRRWIVLGCLLFAVSAFAALPEAEPADVGMDAAKLGEIDKVVAEAIEGGKTPGAVVVVLRSGKVVFRKAYGKRSVAPKDEAMTPDTIFDLASLTKPIATATAIVQLSRQGKLRLDDPVSKHLPAFAGDKGSITLAQLLLHTSGLPSGNAIADYASGQEAALEKIAALRRKPAGEKFVYSDLGYIVLGAVVEKAGGVGLDAYTAKHVFAPLGMTDTSFGPLKDKARLARTAPTEKVGGVILRGVVHDPRARRLGGVAGHAGLFGTADDLAVFAQMLLDGGKVGGRRFLDADDVDLLTKGRAVPGGSRSYGWDVKTAYSGNRGELFAGFGHTGFTGTSLWIDPTTRTALVVLTNRVHPDGKGNVSRLRSRIATIGARAIVAPPLPKR